MKIILLLTYGLSLKQWKKIGILDRELSYYVYLYKKFSIKTTIITYGDVSDFSILDKNQLEVFKIIPIYSYITYSRFFLLRFLKSIFIFYKIRDLILDTEIIKTNQIWGSWVLLYPKIFLKKKILLRCGYEPFKNSLIDNSFILKVIFF